MPIDDRDRLDWLALQLMDGRIAFKVDTGGRWPYFEISIAGGGTTLIIRRENLRDAIDSAMELGA